MKISLTDALHQDEPTFFSIQGCDAMRHSRQDLISVTHIHVHGVAWVVSFDDGCAFRQRKYRLYEYASATRLSLP
jgi:hypothetical protein